MNGTACAIAHPLVGHFSAELLPYGDDEPIQRYVLVWDGAYSPVQISDEENWSWFRIVVCGQHGMVNLSIKPYLLDETPGEFLSGGLIRLTDIKDAERVLDGHITRDAASVRIERWFQARLQASKTENERGQISESEHQLRDELLGNSLIQELATDSPLACDLLCEVSAEPAELPLYDQLALCERCSQVLLNRSGAGAPIEGDNNSSLSGIEGLTYLQRCLVVDKLAYWMIRNDLSSVSVGDIMSRLTRISTIQAQGERDLLDVYHLLIDTGVLREKAGVVVFASPFLQSYFAARAASDERDVGFLVNEAHNLRYTKMIVLVSSLLPPSWYDILVSGLRMRAKESASLREHFLGLVQSCVTVAGKYDG